MKKTLLLNCLLLSFFAKEAKCDRIIFNGDTITHNAKSFLSKYPGFGSLKSKLIDYKSGCYNAEWTITGGQLYLTNVYSYSANKASIKENINAVFHVNNGKLKADWVTKDFWFPAGKLIHTTENYTNIYKAEIHVSILNGKQVAVKRYNYPNSRESIYNRNPYALAKFFAEHINWHRVPQEPLNLGFSMRTGASGEAENIRQNHMPGAPSHSPLYAAEAKRVIQLLPLGIYYRHGKVFHDELRIVVEFDRNKHI